MRNFLKWHFTESTELILSVSYAHRDLWPPLLVLRQAQSTQPARREISADCIPDEICRRFSLLLAHRTQKEKIGEQGRRSHVTTKPSRDFSVFLWEKQKTSFWNSFKTFYFNKQSYNSRKIKVITNFWKVRAISGSWFLLLKRSKTKIKKFS